MFLDATYLHVRRTSRAGGQVTSLAVVAATGVTADGAGKVLGCDVGDSEDEVLWRAFLHSLKERGLAGVRLVISDQHAGLVAALARVFQRIGPPALLGALRPQPARLGAQEHKDMVAAVFRTIFAAEPAGRVCHLGFGA